MSAGQIAFIAGTLAGLVALRLGLGAAQRKGLFGVLQCHRRALAIAGAGLLAGTFVVLALLAAHAETPTALDLHIDAALGPLRHPGLVSVFAWITEFGSIPTLAAVTIVASVLLAVVGPRNDLVPVWVAIIGNEVTTWSAKHLIDRPRPDFALDVIAHSPSFPSGHASGALAVYGILAYVLARRMKFPPARLALVYWTGVAIVAIAFSRVFLDVHYMTDMAGGLAVGGIWVIVAVAVDRARVRD